MNALIPLTTWLQLLVVLAAEVGLIALAVAALRRWSPTAAWGRTFCHAGIIAVLAVTWCELTGSARVFSRWAAGAVSTQRPVSDSSLAPGAAPDAAGVRERLQVADLPQPQSHSEGMARTASASREPEAAAQPDALVRSSPAARMPVLARSDAVTAAQPSDVVADGGNGAWLWIAWAVGLALVGGRALLGRGLFFLFQLRCRPASEVVLLNRVQTLARRLGIRGRVRVIASGRLASPIAFGFLRPTVGLPLDFAARFDPARQDSILAHELAHLAAHDTGWCLLADAATAVLWWHPGAWWLRRQLHLASEMAADEASLLCSDGPRVLAECLVEMGTHLARSSLLGQLRVSGFRSHLGRRVQRLVLLEGRAWSPPPRVGAAATKILGPVALTAAVVLCTAWAAPQALTKGDSMKLMQLSWKRSLATIAIVAAFNGPDTHIAVAQADKSEPAPAASPAAPPGPVDSAAPPPAAQAADIFHAPAPPNPVDETLRRRYGLKAAPAAVPPSDSILRGTQPVPLREAPATPAANITNADPATDPFRARYGLGPNPPVPAPPSSPPVVAENPPHGAKVEAKLKQLVLDEVKFDGLPLAEVLLYLNDQSRKLDPAKVGVNFLINPKARPVALIGGFDPKSGLPLAAATQPFDISSVVVKFTQPLRAVTMRELLDAIVTVADHPIEYTLEDYGVVFAAKPETLEGQPVALAPSEPAPEPAPVQAAPDVFKAKPNALPEASQQERVPVEKPHTPRAELMNVKPQVFNVDFGGANPSEQAGPAAVGKAGDFWNAVTIGFNDHHTESDLKFAGRQPSPIEVEMINLGGAWKFGGQMGVKSQMMDHYDYPTGNKGGNSQVILHHVPSGKYSVYVYGHGPHAPYYGDYELSVGGRDYGRKKTSDKAEAGKYTKWVEGIQYVKFSSVKVGPDESVEILIRPGGPVTDESGRTFSDALICGLQLVPK